MFCNINILNSYSSQKQNFRQNTSGILQDKNAATKTSEPTQINLNNTPSVQNKVIVQQVEPYKKIETFEVPNVGKGQMYQLQNGHKVVILQKQGTTNIYTYVKVGGYDEPARLKGISHLLEHLTAPDEFEKSGTLSNASTTSDKTFYYMAFANDDDKELEKFIQIQSKVLAKPEFSPADIEKEKEIVIAEINSRKKYDFDIELLKLSSDNLFGKNNTDFNNAGDEKSVRSITKEDLIEHHNKFYTPENSVTAIVGDVDPEKTIKIVSKYFNTQKRPLGAWESNSYPDFSYALQTPKRADIISPYNEEEKDARTSVYIDFIGPTDNREYSAASILTDILNEKYSTKSNLKNNSDTSMGYHYVDDRMNSPLIFSFETTYAEGKDKNDLKTIYSTFSDEINTPINDKDFEKAKKAKRQKILFTEKSDLLASYLGQQVLLGFSPNCIKNQLDTVDSLTKKDVEAVKTKYLDLNKASVIVVHPKTDSDKVSFGRSRQLSMDCIKQYELANNMMVVIDNSPGISQTNINLTLETQDRQSEQPQNDASGMILATMLKTSNQKQINLSEGTYINCDSTGNNRLELRVSCDEDKIIPSIKQAKQIMLSPSLTQENFEDSKEKMKELLKIVSKPSASRKEAELYGDTDYKKMYEQLDFVTLDDVKKLHKQIIESAQGHVVITSPTKEDNVPKILQELSQDLPKVKKHRRIEPKKLKSLDKSYVLIDKWNKDSKQALIEQSYKTFCTGNIKDFAATILLNNLLREKLANDLREKQGITYSPITDFNGDQLIMKTDTDVSNNPENLQKVIDGFDRAAKDLSENNVSEEALAKVKKQSKISYLSALENSSSKNDFLASGLNSYYGLNVINEDFKAIDEVTPEQIKRAAQLIFAQHSITSIIAPKEAIEANKNYLNAKGEIIKISE